MIPELDKSWKNTCKIILGAEIGNLEDYEEWLVKYVDPLECKKSAFSGKEVIVSSDNVCKGAKFLSHDEVSTYISSIGKSKFDINDLKDLDSMVRALQEKAYYIGNVVLGNSHFTETVNRCINSSYVFRSQDIYDCKFVAYSSTLRFAQYVFGGNAVGEASQYNIKTFETYKNVRCLETIRNYDVSDCYFTGSLENCRHCMFSFNQKSKNYVIGNNVLPNDRYNELKQKLVDDMRETLLRKRQLPSLVEIVNGDVRG
jgi:hypothetical protein